MSLRIFISYGHDEHADLARKLKLELQQRGHDVWFDEAEIKGGYDWETAIEEGLKSTDIVLALLTPHSVRRPGGVCLDEISFARFMGLKIVPLMVQWSQPPLSISRLQWLDFQNWRESGKFNLKLQELLEVVEEGREIDFEGGQTKLLDVLKPIDFGAEIDQHVRNFIGRKWLLERFDDWILEKESSRIFYITALPGVGKSSLAAYICHTKPSAVAFHFCQYGNQEKSSALKCVQSLAYQLSVQISDYRSLLVSESLSDLPKDAFTLFDRLISQPLSKIPNPQHACVVVIDAVDEATFNNKNELVDLIAYQFDRTPDWLKLLITSRPEPLVLAKLSRYVPNELNAGDVHNVEDIRTFLSRQLEQSADRESVESAVNTFLTKSEGIFLYARIIVEELKNKRLSLEDVTGFPQGLTSVFTFLFERYFPDVTQYEQRQRPLLELVVTSKAPLPVKVAAWLLKWDEYQENEIVRSLGSLFPESVETIRPFHRAVSEWLCNKTQSLRYFVSEKNGAQRFVEFCRDWATAPVGAPRDYVLSYGIDHLLDQDRLGDSTRKTEALELCRAEGGAFLEATITSTGPTRVKEQLKKAFAVYIELRHWFAAAMILFYLRLVHSTTGSLTSALGLLVTTQSSDIDIDLCLRELERFPDESLQRAVALLSLARLHEDRCEESVNAILNWLTRRHSSSMILGGQGPDTEALSAVLVGGPLELAVRLSQTPLFSGEEAHFEVIGIVWLRDPRGPLRSIVLEKLKEAETRIDVVPTIALEHTARYSIEEGDQEIYLRAMRLFGNLSHDVQVENLHLSNLLKEPRDRTLECISHLCKNPRLRKYPSIRAGTCALILAGNASHYESDLTELSNEMAKVAEVLPMEISVEFARHSLILPVTWSMTPAEYDQWLSIHLPLLSPWQPESINTWEKARVGMAPNDALRQFVTQACTVLRWVAAQSDGTDNDKQAIWSSLYRISAVVWLDRESSRLPFMTLERNEAAIAFDALDPISAKTCWDTNCWLTKHKWLDSETQYLSEDKINNAALHEIVNLIFADLDETHRGSIEAAIRVASQAPLPMARNSLEGSPWLSVLERIATAVGVTWQPKWTTKLEERNYLFPDIFKSYLEKLHERILQSVYELGWHSYFLELGLYLEIALGTEKMKGESLEVLLVPTLANLEPKLVAGFPNNETWPPHLLQLFGARKVPRMLAETISSLELCERGMLWGISRDMCNETAGAEWWDSVKGFRNDVRHFVLTNPSPRIIWYHNDDKHTPAGFIEAGLAPVNLLLDDPPQYKDFEQVVSEVNINSGSSYLRLKACMNAYPRREILEWAVKSLADVKEEYSLWLLKPLVKSHSWKLLYDFLGGTYREQDKKSQHLLSGFDAPESDVANHAGSSPKWQEQLEAVLGFGPEERFIYRVNELAFRLHSGTLLEDEEVRRCRKNIWLADDWKERVLEIFSAQRSHQDQIINTLFTVSILAGTKEPALFAAQLLSAPDSELEDRLDAALLWVGIAVAPELLQRERILQVAQSGHGLDALVAIGDWEAVRIHLQNSATTRKETWPRTDRLLHWYHQCKEFDLNAQYRCLQIYNELAPQLLAQRPENREGTAVDNKASLMPIDLVSSELRFSAFVLSKPIINAVQYGRVDIAREWCRAILIEGAYGPERSHDFDCLETLCRCAGAWLSIEEDTTLRDTWIAFVEGLSDEFRTRSIWNTFFGGVADSLQKKLAGEVDHWMLPNDLALIALGEAMTPVVNLGAAEDYWQRLLVKSDSPFLPLRACDAFGQSSAKGRLTHARQYVSLAWDRAQQGTERHSKRFLADLTRLAIKTENEVVLERIANFTAGDEEIAAALGRIALDVFFLEFYDQNKDQMQDEPPWGLGALLHIKGMRKLINALVDEASRIKNSEDDLGKYDHSWVKENIRTGLGWLDALLQGIFSSETDQELLIRVQSWIPGILSDHDEKWKVCERIANHLDDPTALPEKLGPLLDFAIASVSKPMGDFRHRVELILNILKAHYGIDDCLAILNSTLERQSERANLDSVLSWVAVEIEQLLPGSGWSRFYVDKIVKADQKFLTLDDLAEKGGVSLQGRLEDILMAPQSSRVVKRTVDICSDMIDQLSELDEAALGALGSVLSRLAPEHTQLSDELASNLSKLLSIGELKELRLEPDKAVALIKQ